MKTLSPGFFLLLFSIWCRADSYLRQPSVDVVRYEISLELKDSSDSITCLTKVHILINEAGVKGMWLNFKNMTIDRLSVGGVEQHFERHNGRLLFSFDRTYWRGEIALVEVRYHGKPNSGGFLIGKNKYNQRVFFSDNWPDRAHHWFPSIDHPSDKALVDFTVTAPVRYEVVSNGRMVRTVHLMDGRKITQWSESKPIPTYCMVVGVAEFSISNEGNQTAAPIQYWFYPQDFKAAAEKFSRTSLLLQFFSNLIGPYPYEKLAQVQSTTRYGGMENASSIFYSESLFQDPPVPENPAPHEIAHQWFGDSVTPADWDHLWLSEGFATYFEALFYEKTQGRDSLKQWMEQASKIIREYPLARSRPVIDPELVDLMKKLNPLNYQKGAWILHMLRGILGDEKFFEGIRRYYAAYQDRAALTEDFQKAMESTGGVDLSAFFRQWLYQPGWPEYEISWRWNELNGKVELMVRQLQTAGAFDMPMEIAFRVGDRWEKRRIRVAKAEELFNIPLSVKPSSVKIDPDGWLFQSATITPWR
jgi:aminopeptidase N